VLKHRRVLATGKDKFPVTTASYQPSSSRSKTYREKIEGRLLVAKVNGGAAAAEPRGNDRFTVEGRAGARYTVWALNAETFLCDCQAGTTSGTPCWHAAATFLRIVADRATAQAAA